MKPDSGRMLKLLYDMHNTRVNRCLEPQMKCSRRAIRAHSIQNSKVLDLLAQNGQLVAPIGRMDADAGFQVSFGLVGRNRATTFEGLCAKHDREFFLDIDNQSIDPGNKKQLFLLAYRAVIRELHATIQQATKSQSGYIERVNLGLDPPDRPSEFGLHATAQIANSYNVYVYRTLFDKMLREMRFGDLQHDVIELSVSSPTVACSSLFSMDSMQNKRDEVVKACINVIPLSVDRTMVLFSYHEDDAEQSRDYLVAMLKRNDSDRKYQISKLILNHCENFVIAPGYYDEWSSSKRAILLNYFIRTAYHNDFGYDHDDLQLFK